MTGVTVRPGPYSPMAGRGGLASGSRGPPCPPRFPAPCGGGRSGHAWKEPRGRHARSLRSPEWRQQCRERPGSVGGAEAGRSEDTDPGFAVKLARPEQRVGEQEVADLVAPVVEDERAPVGVLAAARVLVLVERGAVEARQRPRASRGKCAGNQSRMTPSPAGAAVDERAEVVGRAVAARRRIVGGDLIAPRPAERVRHDRQQLDVGEPQVATYASSSASSRYVRDRLSSSGFSRHDPRCTS